jgi:hypothetical protein
MVHGIIFKLDVIAFCWVREPSLNSGVEITQRKFHNDLNLKQKDEKKY